MNILSLNQVSLAFGGPSLLDNANLQIESTDRICLLGRNGAGKSSLLRVINGELPPDSGEIIRRQGVTTALVPQEFPAEWHGPVRTYLQKSARKYQGRPQTIACKFLNDICFPQFISKDACQGFNPKRTFRIRVVGYRELIS